MKCDVLPFDVWEGLCQEAKSQLGLTHSKCQVKVYKGVSHALFEITQGLASLFPHKQALAHLKGVSPYYESLVINFARLGYQIFAEPATVLQSPEAWVNQIAKSSVFVLWNDDDPITGQLYEAQSLQTALADKKLFRLRVSHSSHLRMGRIVEPSPYQVEILSLTPDLCVAILGERALFVDGIAPSLQWDSDLIQHHFAARSGFSEDTALVMAFEAEPRTQLRALFPANTPRLSDRAVVYWPDVDGLAAITELAKNLGIQAGSDLLETTSLCRWNTLRGLNWFAGQGWSSESIRGLIVIDQKLIGESLIEALIETRKRILEFQLGQYK